MKTKTYKGIGGTCGVMPYQIEGKSTSVFLSPEELFKSASKLVNIPVVIKKHVTADQIDNNKVGIVTSAYPLDDFTIGVDLQIWDDKAIKYIDNGNVELSAGYTATLTRGDDHWYGSSYAYSKKIDEFDHIVVLPSGDARNRVSKLFLNSNDAEIAGNVTTSFGFNIVDSSSTDSTLGMTTRHIRLPANQKSPETTFEVDTTVADYIETLRGEISTLHTKVSDSNTSSTQQVESLNTQLADSKTALITTIAEKDAQYADLKAKLPSYLSIANKASRLGVSIDYNAFDPINVMKLALSAAYPDIDGQSEATINYLFGTLKEPEPSQADLANESAKERTQVTDSAKTTTPLQDKVNSTVAATTITGVSADIMSNKIAEKRRNAAIVKTSQSA